MALSAVDPARCAAISSWQNCPALASKKLTTPVLMSWLSAAAQNHSLFLTIGPPNSADRLLIRLIGLPESSPFDPAANNSSLTLLNCVLSFWNVPTAEPLNTLEPLLVTRLIDRPD